MAFYCFALSSTGSHLFQTAVLKPGFGVSSRNRALPFGNCLTWAENE